MKHLHTIRRSRNALVALSCFLLLSLCEQASAIEFVTIVADFQPQESPRNVHVFRPLDQFNQWVFGHHFQDPADIETRLDELLESYLDCLEEQIQLTAEQRSRLELAGLGDLASFRRRRDALRKRFEEEGQGNWGNLWEEIQPLKSEYDRGIFTETSLVRKVMQTQLSPPQRTLIEKKERERRLFFHRSMVMDFVRRWHRVTAMNKKERTRIIELVLANTRPSKHAPARTQRQMYDYYLTSELRTRDLSDLKDLVTDRDWKRFQKIMKRQASTNLEPDTTFGFPDDD